MLAAICFVGLGWGMTPSARRDGERGLSSSLCVRVFADRIQLAAAASIGWFTESSLTLRCLSRSQGSAERGRTYARYDSLRWTWSGGDEDLIRLFQALVIAVFGLLAFLIGREMPAYPLPTGLSEFLGVLKGLPHPSTIAGWALLIATLGLFSLIGVFSQLGETKRRFRADVAPYLRIDLSPDVAGGTWNPPLTKPRSELTFPDLNQGRERSASPLDLWAGDTPIYLWVENRQTGSSGIADNVQVGIEFTFPDKTDPDSSWRDYHEVTFSYLEAGHVNRYEIARIDPMIPELHGEVVELRYETMFRRYSSWAHGSAAFSLASGRVRHDRRAFRQREGVIGRQRERLIYWWHSLRRPS